ncbi:unnamed protein product [Onchocerca ochengi]|uniref:PH domain-containing protein n=1 Tax=Onchocerca ochengi TaxID=42157 RepID=A0A182EIV0_ONCOC|nr:unnamed protein product [Onchocerca ochengi]
MATNIIASIETAKEWLENLLKEVKAIQFTHLYQALTTEQRQEFYELRKRIIEDKPKEPSRPMSHPAVNLLQLSLPTFSGDPSQWRQFWSSLNAVV